MPHPNYNFFLLPTLFKLDYGVCYRPSTDLCYRSDEVFNYHHLIPNFHLSSYERAWYSWYYWLAVGGRLLGVATSVVIHHWSMN